MSNTPAFYTITNMQEMTGAVCNSVATPTTAPTQSATTYAVYQNGTFTGSGSSRRITNYVPERTLTDSRDGNTYKIRKLADGNCWMVDNLRLGPNTTINSQNSDLNGSINSYTIPSEPSSWRGWYNRSIPETMYAGKMVKYSTARSWNKVYAGYSINSSFNDNIVGYYYNFYAATAGSSGSSSSIALSQGTDASSSICPKGFKLPQSSISTSSNKKTFTALFDAYGASGASSMTSMFNLNLVGVWGANGGEYGDNYVGLATSSSSSGVYRYDIFATSTSNGFDSSACYSWEKYYVAYGTIYDPYNDRAGSSATIRCVNR